MELTSELSFAGIRHNVSDCDASVGRPFGPNVQSGCNEVLAQIMSKLTRPVMSLESWITLSDLSYCIGLAAVACTRLIVPCLGISAVISEHRMFT